jgi:putative tryptophan/tyrosine transport system substrate-binding protein
MNRRAFITLVGGAAASSVSWPLVARAQQGGRLRRIGMLETVPAAANAANFDAFRRGLRELGYVEGQNVTIEYRSADGRAERFPALAAELVRLPVDVIVTRGTPAALAAKQATATIPVVMAAIGEPLGVGVVASLAHPGGNVTGFSAFVTELSGKRVEVMKEAFPPSRAPASSTT